MADLAGTVVGVISLGLTVCDGLTTYYQGWEARDDDVSSALTSIAQLGKTFELLRSGLESVQNTQPTFNDHIIDSFNLVEDRLKKLEAILKKCRIECPKGTKERFIDISKRAAYPFRKKTISSLQGLVRELTNNVGLLLQVVQLNISTNQETIVAKIANIGSSTLTDVNHIKQKVSNIERIVAHDTACFLQAAGDFRRQFALLQDAVIRTVPETTAVTEQVLRPVVEKSKEQDEVDVRDVQLTLTLRPAVLQEKQCLLPSPNYSLRDSSADSISPRCLCRKRKTKIVNEVKRGPLRIFKETVASAAHHDSCPYYLHTERSTRIGVGTRMLSTLLSRAVECTFAATFGAGGLSIAPSLSLHHIFRPNSPAFQLLDSIGDGEYRMKTLEMSPDELRAEFQRLFQSREASPFDVDQNGRTLLHALFQDSHHGIYRKVSDISPYKGLVLDLADAGVPMNEIDSRGRSPFDYLTLSTWAAQQAGPERGRSAVELCASVVDIGLGNSEALFETSPDGLFCGNRDLYEVEVGRHLDTWIEASECGPLSYAILKRSEKAVQNLLLRNPASVIQERTRFGHTTLHLASGWPVGLKLLLDGGGGRLVNTPSWYGGIPLLYALSVSCIDSMVLLLEAGSAFSTPKAWGGIVPPGLSSERILDYILNGSGIGFDLVTATIKQRQVKLKALARQTIPTGAFEALGIPSDGILEGPPLYSLVQMLDEHKVAIPEELKPPDQQGTVYHLLATGHRKNSRIQPQKLFNAGFYCIDELNHRGLSPLASIYPRQLSEVSAAVEYALWLLSKGANLKRLVKSSISAATAAHHLALNIGASIPIEDYGCTMISSTEASFWGHMKDLDSKSAQFLYDLSLESECDGCCCSCSSIGCTPLTSLLKGTTRASTPPFPSAYFEQNLVWILEWMEKTRQSLSVCSTDPGWIAFANQVFHFATHQRLGLTHLCCEGSPWVLFHPRYDPVRLQGIRDDEALLIAKHRELTAKFMDEYRRQNIPLSTFMKGYWQETMDQVVLDENFAAEKFVDKLRQIGVDIY